MTARARHIRRILDPACDPIRLIYRLTATPPHADGTERDGTDPALGLLLSPWMAETFARIAHDGIHCLQGDATTPRMADWLNIGDFAAPGHPRPTHWGFGRVFEFVGFIDDRGHAEHGHVLFAASLKTGEPTEQWRRARAIVASLQIFTMIIGYHEPAAELEETPQPLTITTGMTRYDRTRDGRDGFATWLGATVTPALLPWLARQPDHGSNLVAIDAMRTAYGVLVGEPDNYGRIGCLTRQPHWINLDVPGQACGLDPESYNPGSGGRGYKLLPHNVDTAIQAVTLLVGLASVCDQWADGIARVTESQLAIREIRLAKEQAARPLAVDARKR